MDALHEFKRSRKPVSEYIEKRYNDHSILARIIDEEEVDLKLQIADILHNAVIYASNPIARNINDDRMHQWAGTTHSHLVD